MTYDHEHCLPPPFQWAAFQTESRLQTLGFSGWNHQFSKDECFQIFSFVDFVFWAPNHLTCLYIGGDYANSFKINF